MSSTYTYILGDATTREAVIIDPVIDAVDRDVQLVNDLGLNLLYAGKLSTKYTCISLYKLFSQIKYVYFW